MATCARCFPALPGLLLLASGFAVPASSTAETASLTVPIVVSNAGVAGSFYTTELSLANRGTSDATVRYTYTAAFGGGGGSATDSLASGRQRTVPDAIAYLISIGLPIPAAGDRGGVLRADFTGLSSADAAAITARTTTAVPGGRAGLSYPGFSGGLGGPAYLCGLRQNANDRSNVALLNAGPEGSGNVILRIKIYSGNPASPEPHVLPDLTLPPGGFKQYNQILRDAGLEAGFVRIEPVAGTAPYYAYATILDQTTSDGSFVPPLTEDEVWAPGGTTLPVVVETTAFATEVVLCNVAPVSTTVSLTYVAGAIQAAGSAASVSITLGPGEQVVIPSFVQYLRDRGVPGVGGPGPTFAGALYLAAAGPDPAGVFLGGRTQTTGGGGRYGLFYTATPNGASSTAGAWLFGLQQNGENRTNLALVNTGETDASALSLHVDLYDGATGSIARSFDVSLGPKAWTQVNGVLSPDISNGYARITRTGGTNPFFAYAVVVDGGVPQTRSDDGAFVIFQGEEPPASAGLWAIRKVEAKAKSLLAAGVRRLDHVRAVADFMATLPEYAVAGVDEGSLTAYGVLGSGRLHLVTDNRDAGPVDQSYSRASGRETLATTELPGSGWARLLQSFGNRQWTQEPVYDLAALLESAPGGYAIRVGKVGDARLSALRAISGDGFLYFNTHGGRAFRTKYESGPGYFSLQSSTLVTPGTEALPEIAADFAAGRLTYFTAPNFDQVVDPTTGNLVDGEDTRYGINGEFVKKYWHLASDSIVFLNACWSAYTSHPEGAQDFIDACWAANAGVYFGWDEKATPGTCYKTVRYFTDRLIGANKYVKENPDQRGFPWELVYADMDQNHPSLIHDPAYGADLIPFPRPGGNSVLLDPSIKELVADEWGERLILKGWFGSRQGKVWVGSKELSGCTWKHDEIRCVLPPTGPGSNGDTYVEVPGELGRFRKSNVRQLTEWAVELKYLWTDVFDSAGWKVEGSGILRYRGDVGGYRLKPHETPQLPLRGMWPTKDSSLRLNASGVYTSGCTHTLSGTGSFQAQTNQPLPPLSLGQALKVDAHAPHVGAIGLALGALTIPPFLDTISGGQGCTGSYPIPAALGLLGGEVDFPLPDQSGSVSALPLPGVPLTFDSQFRIPATKFIDIGMGGEMTIEWRAVEPVPPVKTDLAR